jgi:hypothetical protein
MKRTILLLLISTFCFGVLAQPTTITWQGKLLDASGNAITQNNVAMTFTMFDASTGGNQLWPASGTVVKVVNVLNGLYSVQLGTGAGDDIAFTAAMFDGKTPWLEVKVGTETLPRTEITNVPFALISNDLSAAGWENPGEIGKTTPNTGKFTSVETGSMKITDGASDGKVLTSDATGNTSWATPQYEAPGTEPGQMKYWNGTAWATVATGYKGQIFKVKDGVPTWVDDKLENLTIGDFYRGGFIAYFLQSGDPGYDANTKHGLIVDVITRTVNSNWGCPYTTIGGLSSALGTGMNNTTRIVTVCTSASAAQLCNDLNTNGYSDWYLPSKDELYKLYQNKNLIGGFSNAAYWSSTEQGENAWYIHFSNGYVNSMNKYFTEVKIRATRSF